MNLNYEFKLLNVSDKLQVVAQDAKERLFTVSAETSKNVLILHVKFPPNYPNQKAPVFSFLNGTTVDNLLTRSSILNKVRVVAKKEINHNRRCLEPCLRQFEASVAVLEAEEQLQLQLNNPQLSTAMFGGFQDHNIPFPRSSGARFCGDGHLVTFGWTRQYNVPVPRDETDGPMDDVAKTPRALTAMVGVPLSSGATSPKYGVAGMCSQSPSQDSSYFPFKARVSRVRFSTQKSRISTASDDSKTDRKSSIGSQKTPGRGSTGTVTIYCCSALLPPGCRVLASTYVLPGVGLGSSLSLQEICSRNAACAQAVERPDLVQLWSLAALSSGGQEEGGLPWAQHPMGRSLLVDMMQHYLRLKDIQTVAVLSAVFSRPAPSIASVGRKKHSLPDMRKLDTTAYDVLLARANSENGEEAQPGFIVRNLSNYFGEDEERWQADSYLLDPAHNSTYDGYMKVYSDLLYKWRLLGPRTEMIKRLSQVDEDKHRTNFIHFCSKCGEFSPGPACSSCGTLMFHCSLCRLSCRGLTSVCPSCGHGGHTAHLESWFSSHSVCPTGCGCSCPNFIAT